MAPFREKTFTCGAAVKDCARSAQSYNPESLRCGTKLGRPISWRAPEDLSRCTVMTSHSNGRISPQHEARLHTSCKTWRPWPREIGNTENKIQKLKVLHLINRRVESDACLNGDFRMHLHCIGRTMAFELNLLFF